MSIEATALSTTKAAEKQTTAASANNGADTKSFKDELSTIKAEDEKALKNKNTEIEKTLQNANIAKSAEEIEAAETMQIGQVTQNSTVLTKNQQGSDKNKVSDQKLNIANTEENNKIPDPINELTSKISTLNELKKSSIATTKSIGTKIDKVTDKNSFCQVMTMDNKDATFFINLVENKQTEAQAIQMNMTNVVNNSFTEIKNEAARQAVQVSQTLMDGLNEAFKTGKPFRIDFDNNIAVIMKVDKNGILSANFIPGDAAVENYLRNNIASLRQNFDNQDLQYNELTYSKQQQKQEQKQKNNKENKNE